MIEIVRIVKADSKDKLKLLLIKNLSSTHEKLNNKFIALDKLHKQVKKLGDSKLESQVTEALRHYSKAVDAFFDAKVRIWELD